MAPKNLVSGKRREQQDEEPTQNHADQDQSVQGADSDSDGEAPEEVAAPPKKPKFTAPRIQLGFEPVENGSACSSPSASGFIIVPSQKPRGEKKKKASASKVFSDDDVIAMLKGLSVFWANGRNNKWAEFHLFIKDDLRNQFTKIQVSEKIRALKKKFDANWERARANGGRLDLSDPHELAVFELSKALWCGDEIGIAPEKVQMAGNEEVAKEIRRERKNVGENDEGSKSVKKRKQVGEIDEGSKSVKKRKQVGDENKKMRKQEHGIKELVEEGEEGDARDAANTILSIRKMVDEHGDGNKKARKRKRVDEGDEKEELVKEGIQVDEYDEANKTPSKRKQVDERREGHKKKRKRKQVDERDEANKIGEQKEVDERDEAANKTVEQKEVDERAEAANKTVEQKEVDEHVEKKEIMKEVRQVDQHDEKEELLKERERVDEHEKQDVTIRKQKQVDGHDVKKRLAKKGKQVRDHHEENNVPANQEHGMEIRADDFQCAYPLLYASFDIFRYPRVAKDKCVLIGQEKAQELEEKWREFNAEVHRLELKKLDLMKGGSKGK